jgi:hypothetical protein
MNANVKTNGGSDPLSQEAANERVMALAMLAHRTTRLVADIVEVWGMARGVWSQFVAAEQAMRQKAREDAE